MPTIISPYITDAGLNAAINADANGLKVAITHVVLSTDHFTPSAGSVILVRKEKATISGAYKTGAGGFHVSVFFPAWTAAAYQASAIGFYAGDPDAGGILFATYSHPTDFFVQRNTLDYVAQFAVQLSRVPTGSVNVVVDPSGALALALMANHEGSTDPHPAYVKKFGSGAALPTADVGVIWHDDYNSLMTWQVFNANGANYTGYASQYVGRLEPDAQPTARRGKFKTGAANLSKVTQAALWNWGLHNGIVVPLPSWAAGMNAFADNGDGTFRVQDVRAEVMRIYDDGRGIDVGRVFTAWQASQSNNLRDVELGLTGDGGSSGTIPDDGNWSAWTLAGDEGAPPNYQHRFRLWGRETRMRNFAQLGTIQR